MKKNMKKKPYRSVFSNAIWAFRHQLKFAPKSFLLLMLGIPLAVAQSYMGILLPSLVVKEVTAGSALTNVAVSVGLLMLSIFLCKMLGQAFSYMQDGYLSNYRWSISEIIDQKALGCFYQQFEKKEVRDLHERATKTTQMWNGVQPISDMPRYTAELIINVLSYLLFGSVVSLVHPLLVPILTVAPIVNWVCVRAYNNLGAESTPEPGTPTTVLFLYISILETMDLQLCDPWNSKNVFSPGRAPAAMPLPTPTPQDSSPFAFRSW